jgi:hypothetical protein
MIRMIIIGSDDAVLSCAIGSQLSNQWSEVQWIGFVQLQVWWIQGAGERE